MQLLLDFFPLIAFFVAYKFANIYVATGVLIAGVIVQTAVQWFRHRKVSTMALISAGLVLVFGGLTLVLHDKTFILIKPTVINGLFAVAFLASGFIGEQPLTQRMMGTTIHLKLERADWMKLNWMWIGYFILEGALNLYVARNFPEDVWVKFKAFGSTGITVVFVVLQALWLSSHQAPEVESSTDPSATGATSEPPSTQSGPAA